MKKDKLITKGVSSISKIDIKRTDNRLNSICNHLDNVDELTYRKFLSIMASEANKCNIKELETIKELLQGWFVLFYTKDYIKTNLKKICSETPEAIVSYIHVTFRRHILHAQRPGKLDRITCHMEDIFGCYGGKDCSNLEYKTISDNLAVLKKLKRIKEIVLSLSKKQQLAFLNMTYRDYNDRRDKYLEGESQANRNQLTKRMKDSLKADFSKDGITIEHFCLFLDSEFMSETYILITS